MNHQEAAAKKIQNLFRRRLIFTNNQGTYKMSKSTITAQIVSFKLPTAWRRVFDSTPHGFSEIVGYKDKTPVVRWVDGRWLGDETGVKKLVARYRNVTIVITDKGFDVLGAGNYEQALLAIVKSGWAPKILLKAPPTYKKIDGMFHVNRQFDLAGLETELRKLPGTMLDSVKGYDPMMKFGIPSVVLKLKKPKFTYQFFQNGTVLFSGIKNPKDLEVPKELFRQFLSPVYGIPPAFVFNVSKRPFLTKPRRGAAAQNRFAERYKLAGTWNRLKPAPEGYYIRPGTDGKPRLYPWILFETRGGANYGPFGTEIVSVQVPIRQLNLKAVAPKVLEAFKKVGKPIPEATARVFRNAGHPLVETERPKEPALKNRRAPSWNATKPGFYVRPGPGRQPYWFKVPKDIRAGQKTVIKTYSDAGRNIPATVRELFKIKENVKTEAATAKHVVTMGLNRILHINNRQATRLTKAELLAIARNLNIARATNKTTPAALISMIQRKAGVSDKLNLSWNTYAAGMYYTLGNNGRVARTTPDGTRTYREWATLSAEEKNRIAKAVLPTRLHAEYNALQKGNKYDALRAMVNMNRRRKEANKAAAKKAEANRAAAIKAAANKAAANAKAAAEQEARNNAEAEAYARELEWNLRLSQNLGNVYEKGNVQKLLKALNALPKGARGKPLKASMEALYKRFVKNAYLFRGREMPKKPRKERSPPNQRLNYVYTIPRNAVNLSNSLEVLGINTGKNWTWNEIRAALKGKVTAAQMKKLHQKWITNVVNKVRFGAIGPLKRKVPRAKKA